jgi:hypothetical protein
MFCYFVVSVLSHLYIFVLILSFTFIYIIYDSVIPMICCSFVSFIYCIIFFLHMYYLDNLQCDAVLGLPQTLAHLESSTIM